MAEIIDLIGDGSSDDTWKVGDGVGQSMIRAEAIASKTNRANIILGNLGRRPENTLWRFQDFLCRAPHTTLPIQISFPRLSWRCRAY
jgi:hypothetical protein